MFLENLPQKVFLKDKNSVYISCNKNYAKDLGIKSDEIIGRTDYDFFPKELAEKYRANDKQIIESGQEESIREKYIQQGQEITVHTVKTPVKDKSGETIGLLGVFWNITDDIKTRQTSRDLKRKPKAASKNLPIRK
jgi:PAS domain S-box-containing protein